MGMFSLLTDIATAKLEQTVKEAVAPLPFYLRKLAIGTVVIALSLIGFALMFLFLAASVFLGLSHLATYAYAALWTSLVSFGVGLIFLIAGILTVRKPR